MAFNVLKTATFSLAMAMLSTPVMADEILFKCYFDWGCDPNTKCSDADLDIRFKLDTETNEVTRVGGNQLSTFSTLIGDRAVTFLEIPISGGTTTTTISTQNGLAVHSEHTIEGIDISPRQYLGECITF